MKRIETIKEKKIFTDVIKNGKFKKNDCYIIYIRKRNDEKKQYGIAISNKVGHAVIRNKLKRQTRVIIDEYKNRFKNGYNYIIMIRKRCTEVSFQDLKIYFEIEIYFYFF